uniref:Uncharacterized protein n=1 Tax=Arundo donax TaxID=35708 RepID=A0A0A8Y5I1_ARUDO
MTTLCSFNSACFIYCYVHNYHLVLQPMDGKWLPK